VLVSETLVIGVCYVVIAWFLSQAFTRFWF
jgi:hypothetical protein